MTDESYIFFLAWDKNTEQNIGLLTTEGKKHTIKGLKNYILR